ncbi:hypothetical protein L3Q82_016499, partial [Scortum barcoo]
EEKEEEKVILQQVSSVVLTMKALTVSVLVCAVMALTRAACSSNRQNLKTTKQKNCQSMGGNLASIHNILEYHEIQRLVMSNNYEQKEAWIGGSDAQEFWTWRTHGSGVMGNLSTIRTGVLVSPITIAEGSIVYRSIMADASTYGLGAALYHEQDSKMRVIAYASRGLSSSEKRYPAHKLELLALKWSIVEKFRDYLYGHVFTVVTDNNPLTYVLKSAKLDAASYRWLAALSTFDFNIKYRAGKSNQNADGLSRWPHDNMADDHASLEEKERIRQFSSHHLSSPINQRDLPADAVTVLCQHLLLCGTNNHLSPITLVECLAIHPHAVPDIYGDDEVLGCTTIPTYSQAELQQHQKSDPVIRQVVEVLEAGGDWSSAGAPQQELFELTFSSACMKIWGIWVWTEPWTWRLQLSANPVEDESLATTPSSSLSFQPQDGPNDSSPPVGSVKAPPKLVAGEELPITVEQPPAEEDITQSDMTNETDVTNGNLALGDEKENPADGETKKEKEEEKVILQQVSSVVLTMKALTVSVLVCAVMALTRAAALQQAKSENDQTAKSHLVKRSASCTGRWSEYNGRCFHYVPRPMTWAKAEKNCQSMGGNLASIHNIMEYHAIQTLVMSNNYEQKEAWIGGSDAQEENTWFWSDGKPFHYSNWCPGDSKN